MRKTGRHASRRRWLVVACLAAALTMLGAGPAAADHDERGEDRREARDDEDRREEVRERRKDRRDDAEERRRRNEVEKRRKDRHEDAEGRRKDGREEAEEGREDRGEEAKEEREDARERRKHEREDAKEEREDAVPVRPEQQSPPPSTEAAGLPPAEPDQPPPAAPDPVAPAVEDDTRTSAAQDDPAGASDVTSPGTAPSSAAPDAAGIDGQDDVVVALGSSGLDARDWPWFELPRITTAPTPRTVVRDVVAATRSFGMSALLLLALLGYLVTQRWLDRGALPAAAVPATGAPDDDDAHIL